jgi:hypothetical protein
VTEDDLPESLILLTCAQCDRAMVRACDAQEWGKYGLPALGGRAGGRPYCRACWHHTPAPGFGGRGVFDPESGGQQNAVRALEDG